MFCSAFANQVLLLVTNGGISGDFAALWVLSQQLQLNRGRLPRDEVTPYS